MNWYKDDLMKIRERNQGAFLLNKGNNKGNGRWTIVPDVYFKGYAVSGSKM